jgi:hypothetical protein
LSLRRPLPGVHPGPGPSVEEGGTGNPKRVGAGGLRPAPIVPARRNKRPRLTRGAVRPPGVSIPRRAYGRGTSPALREARASRDRKGPCQQPLAEAGKPRECCRLGAGGQEQAGSAKANATRYKAEEMSSVVGISRQNRGQKGNKNLAGSPRGRPTRQRQDDQRKGSGSNTAPEEQLYFLNLQRMAIATLEV